MLGFPPESPSHRFVDKVTGVQKGDSESARVGGRQAAPPHTPSEGNEGRRRFGNEIFGWNLNFNSIWLIINYLGG